MKLLVYIKKFRDKRDKDLEKITKSYYPDFFEDTLEFVVRCDNNWVTLGNYIAHLKATFGRKTLTIYCNIPFVCPEKTEIHVPYSDWVWDVIGSCSDCILKSAKVPGFRKLSLLEHGRNDDLQEIKLKFLGSIESDGAYIFQEFSYTISPDGDESEGIEITKELRDIVYLIADFKVSGIIETEPDNKDIYYYIIERINENKS